MVVLSWPRQRQRRGGGGAYVGAQRRWRVQSPMDKNGREKEEKRIKRRKKIKEEKEKK